MYDIHIASIGSEDLKVTIWKKDEKTEVSSNTEHVLCPWIPTDMATKASSLRMIQMIKYHPHPLYPHHCT